jgi:hypothetical protein
MTRLRERWLARVRAHELDGLLALGVGVDGRPVLAARAAQVGSARARRGVAAALESAVAEARGVRRRPAAAPLAAAAVRDAAGELLALAAELRCAEAVDARGVVLARRLVSGYGSPLMDRKASDGLAQAARRARWGLGGGYPPPTSSSAASRSPDSTSVSAGSAGSTSAA